jgi:hypothetical protein
MRRRAGAQGQAQQEGPPMIRRLLARLFRRPRCAMCEVEPAELFRKLCSDCAMIPPPRDLKSVPRRPDPDHE